MSLTLFKTVADPFELNVAVSPFVPSPLVPPVFSVPEYNQSPAWRHTSFDVALVHSFVFARNALNAA